MINHDNYLIIMIYCTLGYGVKVGSFPVTSAHDVSGDVYAVNENTLRIVNFDYDGKGPGIKTNPCLCCGWLSCL